MPTRSGSKEQIVAHFIHSVSPSGIGRVELVCWLATAEVPASRVASASCYRLSEDVSILAVVVTELKFCKVQRQILFTNVMIRADDPALEQAPEVLKVVSVYFAAHVLARAMVDRLVVVAKCFEIAIAAMLVCGYQINLVADRFTDEAIQGNRVGILDDLTDHVALARNRSDDTDFAGADAASHVRFLVPMAVSCPFRQGKFRPLRRYP